MERIIGTMKRKIKGIVTAGLLALAPSAWAETAQIECDYQVTVNGKPAPLAKVWISVEEPGFPPMLPEEIDGTATITTDGENTIVINATSRVDLAEVIRMLQVLAGERD